MSKNNDLRSTLKSLTENLTTGNKSASDVAGSLNIWLREGGEALKVKIEDEVERSVSKMGFIKRGEFEALKQQVAALSDSQGVKQEKKSSKKTTEKQNGKASKKLKKKKAPESKSSRKAKDKKVK